jgi:uncharacterized protein (TIGR02271 family)
MHIQQGDQGGERAVPVPGAHLVDSEGCSAHIASIHAAGSELTALVRLDDGGEMMLPVNDLELQSDGSYCLPFAFGAQTHMRHGAYERQEERHAGPSGDEPQGERIVIPVLQEEMQVRKRAVDTGRGIRVHKTVQEREEQIDVELMRDELDIERVPIGQFVDAAALPVARHEGDMLIVPVFEEVLVVEKRVRLVEEVRISKRQHAHPENQNVVLRSEQVSIEHFDEQPDASRGQTDSDSVQ